MGFNITDFINHIACCMETLNGQDIHEFYSDAITIYHSVLDLFDETDLNLFDLKEKPFRKDISSILADIDDLICFLESRVEEESFDYIIVNNSIKSDLIEYLKDLKSFLNASSVEKNSDLFIYSFSFSLENKSVQIHTVLEDRCESL